MFLCRRLANCSAPPVSMPAGRVCAGPAAGVGASWAGAAGVDAGGGGLSAG